MSDQQQAKAKKRAGLSKKLRFEVLKRDAFACQYCGAKAPDVLLQVDHIHPVAAGGKSVVTNLVTSCQPCNSGKSDRLLSDGAVVSASRRQAEELQARKEQVKMMAEWQMSLLDLQDQQAEIAHEAIKRMMPGYCLSESSLTELRGFVARYGVDVVVGQFRESFSSYYGTEFDDRRNRAIGHALRALKWRKKNQEDPTGSQARYLRGIANNRLPWVPQADALAAFETMLSHGFSFDELKSVVVASRGWEQLSAVLDNMFASRFVR